ncbi:MAG: HAD hydrolase-like protein [Actinomycetaceae bacterium]|nr:HAD hydrolase-like protein [Actinomycetaceae bacterium]
MAGQLIDIDPEVAHQHSMAAASRAGRVDVVREAAALTAYASGRYEEALREVRAVRRMRGDDSLRAVEADIERALGRPEKAVEIIDATNTSTLDLAEQVELVLVSSGARADLGQHEVGLVLVDDALAALPADVNVELIRRLMSVKADRLRELGRESEADEVEASMPEEIEDPDIIDVALIADADVDAKNSVLRGSESTLCTQYDSALIDLDGTAYAGALPIDHAAQSVIDARAAGMLTAFVTNNASRTAAAIAEHLTELGHEATEDMVMTSSMDVIAIMEEHLEEGAKVLVIGSDGLRIPVEEAGYEVVDSADDEPAAVVQGLDKSLDWARLSEAVLAINRGALFFATNLDATLPGERGEMLGNGSLVKAVQHASHKRPIAAGKPEPGIYTRGAALVGGKNPLAVGDRLDTDIAGAVAAGIPSLHVLTGVSSARDVITAQRGQRPTYLALDMRGLLENHPRPKHHRDGTWTCGVSQIAKVLRDGTLTLDDIPLTEEATLSLDSYRALAAAAWESAAEGRDVTCPEIHVVSNDDPAGIVEAPPEPETPEEVETLEGEETLGDDASTGEGGVAPDEPTETAGSAEVTPISTSAETEGLAADADSLPEAPEDIPAFLPGEEELAELLAASDEGEDDIQ